MKKSSVIKIFIALLFLFATFRAQTGDDFTITQSVVAGGGSQSSSGDTFSVDGTIGQSIAGNVLFGSPFAVTSGFWNFTPMSPTAASVSVGGRIRTLDGQGIQNAAVRLIDDTGSSRTVHTASFGYFRFDGVEAGRSYIVEVISPKYVFPQPVIVINVVDNINDLDFVAAQ